MKFRYGLLICIVTFALSSGCAQIPPDRYNTQKGAAIGAGFGALIGQAIGGNTEGTLIGLAAGTILGALVGNAVDQDYQAVRDAVQYDKQVIYYDRQGSAVEVIPQDGDDQTNCRKVTKRVWKDGELISETVEEICDDPVVYYRKRPPRVYYYPYYPAFSFYYHAYPRYYKYRPHPYPPRLHRRHYRHWR